MIERKRVTERATKRERESERERKRERERERVTERSFFPTNTNRYIQLSIASHL